jgi:hypothetical protein
VGLKNNGQGIGDRVPGVRGTGGQRAEEQGGGGREWGQRNRGTKG